MSRTIYKLSESEKEQIETLWRSGLNCVQIKNTMNLKGHQQVLNVLSKLYDYKPYKYGRNLSRKFSLNENYFNEINNQNKAYILGFICADGYLDTKNRRLKFMVASKDEEILHKIGKELESNTYIRRQKVTVEYPNGFKDYFKSSIEFCSTKMTSDLIEYGLNSNKTYSLSSSIIRKIPEELIRHFIRGYFDGDGHISYGRKYSSGIKYNIDITGNKEFLENVIMSRFPTKCKLSDKNKSKQAWSYKISSKKEVDRFLTWIYEDAQIFLDRKNLIFKQRGHIKPIELSGNPIIDNEGNQQLRFDVLNKIKSSSETIEKVAIV